MGFKFEKLKVWQKSIDLSGDIHELTISFPKEEVYILTSQIKRTTDSISLNIAEGSTGQTNKEFNRFLGIALRSAIEVVSCLYLAKRRNLIDHNQFNIFYNKLTEIIKMIQTLRKTLIKN
ncbi:four helix bundle protein [Aquimarina sp. U1-2]|uniref:four helix bundle protein n=1 Tax=Aquimarina sp. U1-2 TaxID=2823141 RepID=UPI001AED0D05|nr:four helix bundle protein [Aquimarina sp. U1-2]MBP2832341.1 four helix bundle protein [Aquimarina sp. U1-2]